MSKNNNYKVYVHINKSNGKRYYGITKQEVEERWKNGHGYSSNKHFMNAINKYGWNNFEHIVIAKGLTEEEAKWLEIELIREFDTTNQDKGYNITLGGEGGNGLKHTKEARKKIREASKGKTLSEETRKKISEASKGKTLSEEHRKKLSESHKGKQTGKNHPMYGKKHTKEARKKISEASKGKNHPNYGKTLSEETRKKISEAKKGKNHPNYGKNSPNKKEVYCVELDMYFDTVKEASEYVGCCKSNISQVLSPNYRNKTAKGYHWIYAEDVDKLAS